MSSIYEFEGILDEVVDILNESFGLVMEQAVDNVQAQQLNISEYEPEIAIVSGDWANDRAEIGEKELDIMLLLDHTVEYEPEAGSFIANNMQTIVNSGVLDIPPRVENIFPSFEITSAPIESQQDIQNILIGRAEGNTLVLADLTGGRDHSVVVLEDPTEEVGLFESPDVEREQLETRIISYDTFAENIRRVEEAEEEIPPAVGPAIEQLEELEPEIPEIERAFPDIPDQVRESMTLDGYIEAPAGKPTKKVEARELYEFEYRMGLTQTRLEREDFDAEDQLTNGIGMFTDFGLVSSIGGEGKPASNFPLTTYYIRNRLLFEGPAYPLQLFNDLVIYSVFISNEYDSRYKPSSYDTIRVMLDRLKRLYKEDITPQLVREIPQEEAESRGFDTMPRLPTGEEAPWLEPRNYYEVIEENTDHPAWGDVTGYLYGEEGDEEEAEA